MQIGTCALFVSAMNPSVLHVIQPFMRTRTKLSLAVSCDNGGHWERILELEPQKVSDSVTVALILFSSLFNRGNLPVDLEPFETPWRQDLVMVTLPQDDVRSSSRCPRHDVHYLLNCI